MKHRVGIRSKLYISFVIFTLLCISSLWILEVWFLNDIYKSIRINAINSVAQRLDGMDIEDMQDYAETVSSRDSICTAVYYVNEKRGKVTLIADQHAGGKCVVHNINIEEVSLFYEATDSMENKSFESYLPADKIVEALNRNNRFPFYFDKSDSDDENAFDCILHCQVIKDSGGNNVFCMLSTMIMPVDSTVQTIRFVLVITTFFMLSLAVIFSAFIAKYITKPIISLNKASKTLPNGEFEAPDAKGYREIDELNNTLSTAAQEINKVDDIRREFLANVSHDLRTPLTLISGYSEVMRDLPGENTPENLQTVIDETNRLSALVNDILDISKYDSGMDNPNFKYVNITSLINAILTRYKKFVDKNGYTIEFNYDSEYYIYADKIKMEQVVYNLVNNAINYCGEDKKVIVSQTVSAKRIRICIEDHGSGIERDKLGIIWERYYKVDKNHKSAKVGTGLGLSIVKKILDLHNAEYGVQSELGKGSIFWFEFPVKSNYDNYEGEI